jgi:hypothetical protein
MKKLQIILIALLLVASSCNTKKQDADKSLEQQKCKYAILDSLDTRVKQEKIPATNVLSLAFSGNYQKHPEAYGQLSEYANKNYAYTGGIIGIYPQDPDLVSDEAQLNWEITLRVLPGKAGAVNYSTANPKDPFETNIPQDVLSAPLSKLKIPEKPYILKTLPATDAVTLVSDVAHIGQDGLAINAWIDLNNFVQNGTTRTEFGSANQKSQLIPVKIIVPVKKRNREKINK